MLYTEFMEKVCDICIFTNEITGKNYVAPCYKLYLKENDLDPNNVDDMDVTIHDVKEYLDLEVIKRNVLTDRISDVIIKLDEFLFGSIDAYVDDEANEMTKALIEYMQLKKMEADSSYSANDDSNINGTDRISKYNFSKRVIE